MRSHLEEQVMYVVGLMELYADELSVPETSYDRAQELVDRIYRLKRAFDTLCRKQDSRE